MGRACRMGFVAMSATALLGCGHGDVVTVTTTASAKPTASAPAIASEGPTAPRTSAWVDLAVGDCLVDPPPTDPNVIAVAVVGCTTPHMAEVYFRGPVAVNRAVVDVADRACAAAFAQYTGLPAATRRFTVSYLIDSSQDRTAANPDPSTVICLLSPADGHPVNGSARR